MATTKAKATTRGPRPITQFTRELERIGGMTAGATIALAKLLAKIDAQDARTGRPDPRLRTRATAKRRAR